jgi:hypothetical protein
MLRKLNAIIFKLRIVDEKLDSVLNIHNQKSIEGSAVPFESEEDSTNHFPVTSEEEFQELETLLADQIRFKKEVCTA